MITKATKSYLLMRTSIRIIILIIIPEKLMFEEILFVMRFAIVLVTFL